MVGRGILLDLYSLNTFKKRDLTVLFKMLYLY